jgi:polyisoprenoid-binding protein YceI
MSRSPLSRNLVGAAATLTASLIGVASTVVTPTIAWAASSPTANASCKLSEKNRIAVVKGIRLQCTANGSGNGTTAVWKTVPAKPSAAEMQAMVGTWKTAAGSQAGYRMREFFVGGVAKSEAVGRTTDVTGTIIIDQSSGVAQIRSTNISVQTATLKSDKPSRDEWLQSEALETATYKTATFESTSAVTVNAPREGEVLKTEFPGRLTLHGETRPVTMIVEARRTGDVIDIVGSTRLFLADFKIEAPLVPGVVSADDSGLLEFALVLKR